MRVATHKQRLEQPTGAHVDIDVDLDYEASGGNPQQVMGSARVSVSRLVDTAVCTGRREARGTAVALRTDAMVSMPRHPCTQGRGAQP